MVALGHVRMTSRLTWQKLGALA